MRHFPLLFSLLIAVSLSGEETVFSLADVLDQVDRSNPVLLADRELPVEARQRVRQERSTLLPSLNLTARQTRSRGSVFGPADTTLPASAEDPVDVASRRDVDAFTGGFQASWEAFDVNRISRFRIASLDERLSELSLEVSREAILLRAALGYFRHLRNESSREVILSNITRARSLLDLARSQFQNGIATEIDVIRARFALAQEERALLQQEVLLMESALNLEQLMGLPPRGSIRLGRMRIVDPVEDLASFIPDGTFIEKLPQFQREELVQEQNRLARRAASLQRLPSLRFFGDYGIRSEHPFDGDERSQWSYGVALSIPLFEGLRFRADRLQADSRIRRQSFILQEIESRLEADARLVVQELRSRFRAIDLTETQKALAQSELELAQTRFRRGLTDNREVVEAQNNLARAEDLLVDAIFQYNLSRLELARLKGDVRSILSGDAN